MSGNVYEFRTETLRSEITQDDINSGILRARVLRSQFISAAFSGAFRKGIEAVAAWNRRYNQARHLENLPDYLLKDVGIERYQIESVISDALSRDPLSLDPTGSPSSQPAFWRGAAEANTEKKLAA